MSMGVRDGIKTARPRYTKRKGEAVWRTLRIVGN